MLEDLDEVLALKASAKTARDDGDWEGAMSDLEEALNLLQELVKKAPSPTPSSLASELADTYGMIGGVQKRWGLELDGEERRRHLMASVDAYDKGFLYERGLQPSDANTYNQVNRLVGRVLLNPSILEGDDDAAELEEELRSAEEVLTGQIGSTRQKDPWAYSDLGTIRLLRRAPEAMSTLHELDRLRPPPFVYDSALTTLKPLGDVASDLLPDLTKAVAHLQRSARYVEQSLSL